MDETPKQGLETTTPTPQPESSPKKTRRINWRLIIILPLLGLFIGAGCYAWFIWPTLYRTGEFTYVGGISIQVRVSRLSRQYHPQALFAEGWRDLLVVGDTICFPEQFTLATDEGQIAFAPHRVPQTSRSNFEKQLGQ